MLIKLFRGLYIFFLFFVLNITFSPIVLLNIGKINGLSLNFIFFLKIATIGMMAALISVFILPPMVFRAVVRVKDKEIYEVLSELSQQMGFTKMPEIYEIRTAQINSVPYWFMTKKCIGLTTGTIEAFQKKVLNRQDIKCILSHALAHHLSHDLIKYGIMYGIVAGYEALGYILIFSGRGFSRLAKMTVKKESQYISKILGYILLLAGVALRLPAKIGSLLASPLIIHFQKKTDIISSQYLALSEIVNTLKKVFEINQGLCKKKMALLPYPEYYYIKPIRLLKIDQIASFVPDFNKRLETVLLLKKEAQR